MIASELIHELEQAINEHGDLPVFYVDDDAQGEVRELEIQEAGHEMNFQSKHVNMPKRIVIA